ncbi:hypothetical protein SNE40_001189 [Patella caerulea]|uniref:G8 domain-containing protein n=1 Tax=Patella caerulea TaxID=87958 RepID=A0AAN8KFE4_PATCE
MCSDKLTMFLVLLLTSVLVNLWTVNGMCPDQIEGLMRWSNSETWPENAKPDYNAEIYITTPVLLDESPPKLHAIIIQPGGRLIWSTEGDYTVYVDYILIHGQMDIGSEDCKYERKARIVLTGNRFDYDPVILEEGPFVFNEKFIGIAPGGTLELHGREKTSWTKLTQTVEKLTPRNGLIYGHKGSEVAEEDNWKPGLLVYVIDETTGYPVFGKYYYLGGNDPYWSTADLSELVDMLNNVDHGRIISLAVNKNAVDASVDLTPLAEAIEMIMYGTINGASTFRGISNNDAYTLVAQKGNSEKFNENISPNHGTYTQYARSDLTFWELGIKILSESYINNQLDYKSWVDLRIATTDGAYPILHLLDDVSSWDVGDKVVLSSTDYSWEQSEEAVLVPCPDCSSNQVRVEMDSKFMHFGEVTDGVDERGEVSLLTRNILIEGQMAYHCPPSNGNCDKFNYDTFGGHIKFVKGFENGHIEGVELYHMGQQTAKGHYPIHFHMAYEYGHKEHPPYANHNSVHKSYARCYTVHGTHGITLKGNVGYDCLGHCYFLEDGGEKRTVFDGNIGLSTRKGLLIPSDSEPATFWITNPLTYFRNNVAAGSENVGIWHIFPDAPVGLTVGLPGFMEYDEAKHTPYLEWNNNVAHSNPFAGLYIDEKVFPDDTIGGDNDYAPREDPLDPDSSPVSVDIIRPTLYKNRYHNAWIRGGGFNVIHGSFADSAIGITFARSTDQAQYLSDSVIIGQSRNMGEPTKLYDDDEVISMPRSFAIASDVSYPIKGLNFFDSSIYVNNVWFSGFETDEYRSAGAIGFRTESTMTHPSLSSVQNAKFSDDDPESSRIFDDHSPDDVEGSNIAFADIDGSVTGIVGSKVLRIGSPDIDEGCHFRAGWNVAVCPNGDMPAPNALATSAFLPGSWGAGYSRVHDDNLRVDGEFGEWSIWSDCVDTNEGAFEWRYRACNSPVPQNGGHNCFGATSQSRSCDLYE